MPARVPLAWLNLTHNTKRFALSLAGVGFAVVLVFIELGFYHALLDANVALIDRFDADLVMVSSVKTAMVTPGRLPRRRLVQALGVPGVASVTPLYVEEKTSLWRGPGEGPRIALRVLAVDPDDPALAVDAVARNPGRLRLPDRVLFDRASVVRHQNPRTARGADDLAGRDAVAADEFWLGRTFVHEGNLIVGQPAFAHFFPAYGGSALRKVEAGMIRLEKGADPARVKAALTRRLRAGVKTEQAATGTDVTIWTKAELRQRERDFWRKTTPIGFIFTMGAVMGLIVGVVICYQVLATDVADHLAEFATLKAMGYSGAFLCGVVLRQALWLALVGFVPGALVSAALFAALSAATGLPLHMTWDRAAVVLAATVGMCTLSGLITVRKVLTADPVELF